MAPRLTKDGYFMAMLAQVSARSTCVRRAVGAILADADGRILSAGYNGPPRGFSHCTIEDPCLGAIDEPGDSRRCLAVHAEMNCLLFCWRLDLADTLYTTVSPCFGCAKVILQTKIQRVVTAALYPDGDGALLLTHKGKLWTYNAAGTVQLIG